MVRFSLVFLLACGPQTSLDVDVPDFYASEVAFPDALPTGSGMLDVKIDDDLTLALPYTLLESHLVTEGDIVLGTLDSLSERSVHLADASRLWPDCTVPYELDASVPYWERLAFLDAVDHYEAHTALRFVEDDAAEARLHVIGGSGCWSYMGRTGAEQPLSLGLGCSSAAIHEIGHAVGLWHEQSRSDAAEHVALNLDVVPEQWHYNFRQQPDWIADDHGAYDFGSNMHYASWSFSTEPCSPSHPEGCSITHLDGSYITEVQREVLSPGDIASLASLYGAVDCALPATPDLAITRYLEGSFGSNKLVQIEDFSAADTDLTHCSLDIHSNGRDTASRSIPLVDPGADDVLLLCHTRTALETATPCDVRTGSLNFNGNDALVLRCGNDVIQRIGQVGVDPGSAWTDDDVTTRDASLVLNTPRTSWSTGTPVEPRDAYAITPEWDAADPDDAGAFGLPWAQ